LLERFSVVTKGLRLSGKPLGDEAFLLWSNVFCKGSGDKPILNIASHVKSIQWLG
jgi:hypothetical protein